MRLICCFRKLGLYEHAVFLKKNCGNPGASATFVPYNFIKILFNLVRYFTIILVEDVKYSHPDCLLVRVLVTGQTALGSNLKSRMDVCSQACSTLKECPGVL